MPRALYAATAAAVAVSAMHCGVEALLTGATAIMDHLLCRDIDDVAAAVAAYKALGIRAYIAPMLGDDLEGYSNYIPLARDAEGRNAAAKAKGICDCGAMCNGGMFRTSKGVRDPAKTQANLDLWTEAAQRFHDPENGKVAAVPMRHFNNEQHALVIQPRGHTSPPLPLVCFVSDRIDHHPRVPHLTSGSKKETSSE